MRWLGVLLAGLLCVVSTPAQAQAVSEAVVTGNATTRLYSEKAGIAAGETILIGFHQKLRKGWHVYWLNPGDSGLPLDLDWTLPDGFAAGEVLYPVPHRLPLEMLMNYGHEGEPTFLIELTAPPDAVPGTLAELVVDATWLICDDICIPEDAILSLSLPVVAEPAGADPLGFPIIENAKLDRPVAADFTAMVYDLDGAPVLHLDTEEFDSAREIHYFPYAPSLVEPAGAEIVSAAGEGLAIRFEPGFEYDPAALENLDGVLTTGKGRSLRGYIVRAPRQSAPAGAAERFAALAADPPVGAGPGTSGNALSQSSPGLAGILLLAFLGGIILNVMPCVFPVVFLKAAGLARVAHTEKAEIRVQGLLYTAGVIVTFLGLAALLILLRAGGEQVGWGFHLQSPIVVSVFAIVIFLVGLNLAGLFDIGTSLQGAGASLAARGGRSGAFFTGLLAVAVAAPCIGPFLGVPVGFALVQPAATGLAVFGVMGLGLALPYLLISLLPGLAGLLPKPGPWMETFKQVLSFAMFATLIWLIWTLTLQAGPDGLVSLLIALLLAGFAAWIFGRGQRAGGGVVPAILAIVALLLTGYVISGIRAQPAQAMTTDTATPGFGDLGQLPMAIFSEASLAEYRARNVPVFIDFTAAWCVTCQVNKQRVLKNPEVVRAFHDRGVVYMVADWTLQDPEITAALEAQGRSGVPLYLYYAPGAENPVVLPQLLSRDLMIETFAGL